MHFYLQLAGKHWNYFIGSWEKHPLILKLKGRDDFSHSHLLPFDPFKIPFGLCSMRQLMSISRLWRLLEAAWERLGRGMKPWWWRKSKVLHPEQLMTELQLLSFLFSVVDFSEVHQCCYHPGQVKISRVNYHFLDSWHYFSINPWT